MTVRRGVLLGASLVLALAGAGCTGDADKQQPDAPADPPAAQEPGASAQTDGLFHGTYVGRAPGSGALVAVSAAEPADGVRDVAVFLADGEQTFVVLPEVEAGNRFTARSGDGKVTVTGQISETAVSGTLRTASGRADFRLERATGASGLYESLGTVTG